MVMMASGSTQKQYHYRGGVLFFFLFLFTVLVLALRMVNAQQYSRLVNQSMNGMYGCLTVVRQSKKKKKTNKQKNSSSELNKESRTTPLTIP